MVSKKMYFALIFRVVILTLTTICFSFFILEKQIVLTLILSSIIFIQVILLINHLNKNNRKIAYFFNAVENEDSTIYFPEESGNKSIKELNKSLNRVNRLIQKVKIENEIQEQYYQTIIEQADVGMLSVNSKGHILFVNSKVKKLLNYESLTHLQQLKKIDKKLFTLISQLKPFEQKVFSILNERESVALTVKASTIKINTESLLLVVFQNIHLELATKEVDSWVGLIRVLTHEIMNSIAPITSLSETLVKTFRNENRLIPPIELNDNDIVNTVKGLDVIQNQGNNLINFVASYRSFTKLPRPDKELLSVQVIFEKIRILVSQESWFENVRFKIVINPNDLEVFADEKQLIQVLINLVKNAIQSLQYQKNGIIELTGTKNFSNKVVLSVSDNGPGIPNNLSNQIFIPFFTTKEKGMGIGLSLSKHIMRLHNGNLTMSSTPNHKTSFKLVFE